MKLTTISTALAIMTIAALIGPAAISAPAIEEAYEVTADDVTLPANEFGSIILKPCRECDLVTLRVDGRTTYVYDGTVLPLREFRDLVLNLKRPEAAPATIIYRLEDGKVRRIDVLQPLRVGASSSNARG